MANEFTIRRIGIAVRNLEHAGRMYGLMLGEEFRPVAGGRTEEVLCMECDRGPGLPAIELAQPVDVMNELLLFFQYLQ